MPPVVVYAVRGLCLADRLPGVMQQHGKPQDPVRLRSHQGPDRMLAHRDLVVRVVLDGLHLRVKFRKDHLRDAALPCQADHLRMRRDQQFFQFHADALRAHHGKGWRQPHRLLPGRRIQAVPELRAEANGTQDPQRVLREPLCRISDTAHDPAPQILQTAEQVDDPVPVIVCHGVDREVAPLQIFHKIRREADMVRMPVIRVIPVDPEGRDLQALAVHADRDRPVLDPGIDRPFEYLPDLIRRRAGRNIPVIRSQSEHAVANTAAHHIGFITAFVQPVQDLCCRFRYIYFLSAVCHHRSLSCMNMWLRLPPPINAI